SMAAMVAAIRGLLEERWTGAAPEGSAQWEPWAAALARLGEHLSQFREREGFLLDPFAPDVVFPPVFKVFHGLANQLRLKTQDEALIYHLLLQCACPDTSRFQRIPLLPD